MDKTGFKTRTELVSEARGLGIVIKEKKEDESQEETKEEPQDEKVE